jgi:hypothetical protein
MRGISEVLGHVPMYEASAEYVTDQAASIQCHQNRTTVSL